MSTIVDADDQFIYINDNKGKLTKRSIVSSDSSSALAEADSALAAANTASTDAATALSSVPKSFSQLTGLVTQDQLSTPTPNWFNVKKYGAKGDTKVIQDAVSSSSDTITSSTANFSQDDVGKVCWGIESASGIARVAQGTISSVSDASTCHVLSSGFTAGYSNLWFVWGTDDTASLQNAFIAAKIAGIGSGGSPASETALGMGTVYIPAGGYIFQKLCFNNDTFPGVSIIGDGPQKTIFYPSPNFDFSTTSSNSGMLNSATDGSGFEIGKFSVEGNNFTYSAAVAANRFLVDSSKCFWFHDVMTQDLSTAGSNGLVGGICGFNTHGMLWQNIFSQAINGTSYAIYLNGLNAGTFVNVSGSNSSVGIGIVNCGSVGNNGGGVTFVGGLNDENEATSLQVSGSIDISFIGYRMFGGSSLISLSVDGTSDISIFGCPIGPFGADKNGSGATIASGGILRASACRFHRSGSGVALTNNGTFYDLGGNQIASQSGSGSYITSVMANSLQFGNGSSGTSMTTTTKGTGTGPITPQTVVKYIPITLPEGNFWIPLVQ